MVRKGQILSIYHLEDFSVVLEPLKKNSINGARRFKALIFEKNVKSAFTYTFTSHYMTEEDEARFIVDYHYKKRKYTIDDIENLEEE